MARKGISTAVGNGQAVAPSELKVSTPAAAVKSAIVSGAEPHIIEDEAVARVEEKITMPLKKEKAVDSSSILKVKGSASTEAPSRRARNQSRPGASRSQRHVVASNGSWKQVKACWLTQRAYQSTTGTLIPVAAN
eukprot:GILJ01032361.1.p1 GENE.GILJ01032361.1~~GILJ01032361.1.p1  ORF type:complete len:135 (-),score=22.33 GILJ01032361.1:26-430(-)